MSKLPLQRLRGTNSSSNPKTVDRVQSAGHGRHIMTGNGCFAGNVEVVDALTAAGAALDATSPAGTPLLWAAGSGQAGTVRALLGKGCQRDAVTEDGVGAALMAAAMGEHGITRCYGDCFSPREDCFCVSLFPLLLPFFLLG